MGKKDKHKHGDKIPSPCIDICKDIRGVCIGCGRSKAEKKAWKKADSEEERIALVQDCLTKTEAVGTQELWVREYRRKCLKAGSQKALALIQDEDT